jgi:hypothetical protein
MMRCARRAAAIAGVVLWLGIAPAEALAGAPRGGGLDSFAGLCSIHATARFTPPIAPMKPGPAKLVNDGGGSCTGTLDGTTIENAPVTEHIQAPVYADGCLAAHTTAPGDGTLRFQNGIAIRFRFEFSGVLSEYPVAVQGEHSGSAHGRATFITTRTEPVNVLRGCSGLTGGLRKAPIDITLATESPLTSTAAAHHQSASPRKRHPSTPDSSGAGTPTSFAGSCQLSGTVRFDPGMTTTPQSGYVDATANGTCTGTLTHAGSPPPRRVRAAPAELAAQSHGTEACELGRGTGNGQVTIAGRKIDFTYSEVRAGPVLTLRADGASGGSAIAEGNVSPGASPVSVLQACGSTGLTQAPIDIRLTTTPTMSG